MVRMQDDLFPILYGSALGKLDPADSPTRWGQAAVCVVIASDGYPRSYEVGVPIEGLAELEGDPDVFVFHAGTRRHPAGRRIRHHRRTRSRRVTARGRDVAEAAARAYAAADRIRFRGMQLRRDIAATRLAIPDARST